MNVPRTHCSGPQSNCCPQTTHHTARLCSSISLSYFDVLSRIRWNKFMFESKFRLKCSKYVCVRPPAHVRVHDGLCANRMIIVKEPTHFIFWLFLHFLAVSIEVAVPGRFPRERHVQAQPQPKPEGLRPHRPIWLDKPRVFAFLVVGLTRGGELVRRWFLGAPGTKQKGRP